MPIPLYQRVAQDLVQKVTSGALPVGTVLPSELDLMESYGTSRNTVPTGSAPEVTFWTRSCATR